MKKLGNLLCTAIALIAMTSCGAFKSYVADYSITPVRDKNSS